MESRDDLARCLRAPATAVVITESASGIGEAVVASRAVIGSIDGLASIYSAANGGTLSLARSLADSLASEGIWVNTVSPGMIETPMLDRSIPVDARPAITARRVRTANLHRPNMPANRSGEQP